MPEAARTYWLTSPCRIRRKDRSLLIERENGTNVHIPITDVRDLVAAAPVDINTAAISLLNQHRIDIHILGHFGDYAGSLLTAENHTSGETVLAQARLADSAAGRLRIAGQIVKACAFNVRRVTDRKLLDRPYRVLVEAVATAEDRDELMGIEGNFRRTAWAVVDTKLPDWLQLGGRSRRPPKNAGTPSSATSTASSMPESSLRSGSPRYTAGSGSSTPRCIVTATRLPWTSPRYSNRSSPNAFSFAWRLVTSSNYTTSTATSTKPRSAQPDAPSSSRRSGTSWPPPSNIGHSTGRLPTTNCCTSKR